MKKIVNVVGIGHKTGEKKDGTKYDFYQLYGVYDDPDTEGHSCVSVVIPESEVSGIKVGDSVQLHTHFYNGREYYDACFIVA